MISQDHIRNFCIVAHIDHGKSTLADRFLLHTGAITPREFRHQMLDEMDIERERGITIKASAVRLVYHANDGGEYLLNLIDTPGHVDFSYEVSKALAACEGAILVVDAAQGVEAQTVANYYLAKGQGLTVIPVINKIDLANAEPDRVKRQLVDLMKTPELEISLASAKEGRGVEGLLERVIHEVPPPGGSGSAPLAALIFDSMFDVFKGVVIYVRVFSGVLETGLKIQMMGTRAVHEAMELGIFTPRPVKVNELGCGMVGYLTCNIKDPKEVHLGDTITEADRPAATPLPGYRRTKPLVFCGLYPVNPAEFNLLREALDKLSLNDASFTYEPESSMTLGFGFRCGFLGLLSMEIVQERLEREFDLSLIVTTPSVVYRVLTQAGEGLEVETPAKLPPPHEITTIEEPYIHAFLLIPANAIGAVMSLAQAKRGDYCSTQYLDPARAMLTYEFPLAEVLVDFYDRLKSVTRGYGSMDYEVTSYRATRLAKLDILLNGEVCDALSFLVYQERAQEKAHHLVKKLKEYIPRQLFEVVIQAAIGSRIIARETIRPIGKHVTGKCYGGDITRKRKLWERQRAGKRRMKQFGRVEIPQEAFLAILKIP